MTAEQAAQAFGAIHAALEALRTAVFVPLTRHSETDLAVQRHLAALAAVVAALERG